MFYQCKFISYFAGQNIDFLSLLKSFGSDMDHVAKAIGVDIGTLNNMDKDILLEMLTTHGGSGDDQQMTTS